MTRRILVVEDERDLARLLEIHLTELGAEIVVKRDGPSGLEAALAGGWDLVILDVMLPGQDGLEICRQIRRQERYTPVLMLTARRSELDRVLGLEIGADDYVTKPFSIRELVARVKAVFRRADAAAESGGASTDGPVRRGALTIDPVKRKVLLGGEERSLTAKEFDLLELLARHPGRVYSRAQLLDSIWGYTYDGYEHTLVSHVNRLRRKIEEDPSRPRYILTVRGVGYRFSERPVEEGG